MKIFQCFGFVCFLIISGVVATQAEERAVLTVQEAYDMATDGDVLLVDVRWPHEWEETGIAEPAHAISMHESGFLELLDALVDGDHSRPIAIICAVGVRSAFMQVQLAAYAYTDVMDVPEGMLGSEAGPGWLAEELPIRTFEQP